MTWLAAHTRRIPAGASIVLIGVGTAMAFALTIWGLLPRRQLASRWSAAADLVEFLSVGNAAPLWLLVPLATSTALLFPALVWILAQVRASRFPWLGAAAAGVLFGFAATVVTGSLLGVEMAVWLPADPAMRLSLRPMLPLLGGAMALPVTLLLLPVHLIAGGALYGMLVAAFVTPIAARQNESSNRSI